MRVLKIIQANPEVFDIEKNKNYSEREAIIKVASVNCQGNDVQREIIEIRLLYTAVCNLMDLGSQVDAVELATSLIQRSEQFQQFKIAQDLCDRLITHFYHESNLELVHLYKTLYDKYTLIIKGEHESKLLFGKVIHNQKQVRSIDKVELTLIMESIKAKLPYDPLWSHYYYFHYKSLLMEDQQLEQIFLEAISYFERLYFRHYTFIRTFCKSLAQYYEESNDLEKAEEVTKKIEALSSLTF